MKTAPNKLAFALTSLLVLPACSWVDSTGRTNNVAPEIGFDETTIGVAERESLSVPITDDSAISANFRELASGKSVAASCGEWFSADDAADSLEEACVEKDNCSINFAIDENDGSSYLLTSPAIYRPVALQYRITAEDIDGEIDNHTFNMCISSINDAPEAQADIYYVEYQQELKIPGVNFDEQCQVIDGQGVLDNDEDDRDYQRSTDNCISAKLSEAPNAHRGNFKLRGDGGFSYVSDGTLGPGDKDTFSYVADDGDYLSVETKVTVEITGENQAPVANTNVMLSAFQGEQLSIEANDLATDPEGYALSTVAYTQPSHGVSGLKNGVLYYLSDADFNGSDSFSATVSDLAGSIASVDISIEVVADNSPPEIRPIADIKKAYSGTPTTVDLIDVPFRVTDLETENQILTVSATSSAKSVVAVQQIGELDSTGRGTLSLQPLRNGDANITLTVRDQEAYSLPAKKSTLTFKVSIEGMREQGVNNTKPKARNDKFSLKVLQTRTFDVASNDSDEDGDELSYRIIDRGQLKNRAKMTADGQLTIKAPFSFTSSIYWVEYEVDDGWGGVDTATARITVSW